jgi:apolipoprotein N-acyltransferase
LYPLAWIALVPLFGVILSEPNLRRVAVVSYIAGLIFYAGTFYWMTETMIVYGGLDALSAVGIGLLFTLIYAFSFLAFGAGVHLAVRRFGTQGIVAAAPLWVTIELIRTHFFFSGFPWMLSGYALVPYSGILQIVTWTGIYGLSFIVAFVNSAIAFGVYHRSRLWLGGAAAAMGVMWFLPIIGESSSGDPIPVRIVQANISLNQPWEQPEAGQLLDELETLSTDSQSAPRLVVWPETPAPFYLSDDPEFRGRMQRIAQKLGSYFLVGYIDMIGEDPSNSAALLNPTGEIVSRYDKMHLVPFGEYIPFKNLLFFAESFTRQVGNFAPGTQYTVSMLDGHRISTAICYESIFPDLMRQFVKQGSELLVLITNDGWFGESSAPFQHLRMGVVRAVENRRYMVRTANTGVSAIIDPYGRIESSTPIGVRTILDGTARFRSDLTFYTRYGNVFAYANVLAAAAILMMAAVHGRRENDDARRTRRKIRST